MGYKLHVATTYKVQYSDGSMMNSFKFYENICYIIDKLIKRL